MSAVEIMFGMLKYDLAAGPGPTQNASSACRTCNDSRSGSEKIATVFTPSSRQARLMRNAISPRFAMSTFLNTFDLEEHLPVFNGLSLMAANRNQTPRTERADRVANAQRLDECQLAIGFQHLAGNRQRTAKAEN